MIRLPSFHLDDFKSLAVPQRITINRKMPKVNTNIATNSSIPRKKKLKLNNRMEGKKIETTNLFLGKN